MVTMNVLDIPQGYKKTEVGVIPEDWELAQLSNLCERISVGLATSVTKYYRNKGVPIVRNMNIRDGYFDSEDMLYLDSGFAKKNISKAARAFDVITVHTGSNIGLTCVLPENFDYCQTFTTLITTTNKKRLNPFYLSFHMGSESGKKEILRLQVGGGKGNLNTGELKQYLLSYPKKLTEQTAIATALSDVDALICELEKLIAKKQAIKTATMQQLLTGKTRLPQFALCEDGTRKGSKQSGLGEIPEDWEAAPFGEMLTIRHGKNQKNVEDINGVIPILATGGQIGWANQYLWNKPSVLIGRKGTIDKPRYIDKPFWTIDTLFYSEIKDCANSKFIFYKFCMIDWIQYNEASGVPSLNASTIERVLVSLPYKREQTAIATILSDMDSEIQALEKRLNKTRQIKQGMMQELMTGKTRLVQPEARGV